MVDILTVMSRDVDVMGLVILYPLDVAEKRPGAVAFEGWEHLNREAFLRHVEYVYDIHMLQ